MRKIFATISALMMSLVVISTVSAGALTCPTDYQSWKGTHSFYGGFEGLCSYYTRLSAEDKVVFKETGNFNITGVLSSLPLSVWSRLFLQDWSNGNFNLRVE